MFDVTARVKDAKPQHFFLGTAPYTPDAAEIVRYGVMDAAEKHAGARMQPLNCHGKYGPCRWLPVCPRRGTVTPELIEIARDYVTTRRT